ncbi:hypothetical protein ACDQ55_16710 [Chitinophaga sp. 30R24]|uniref:hypothetical protein n=1 Tax=Chitinophaga sp. 30R24 TaxID=3248838 RepID=UPI003B900D61
MSYLLIGNISALICNDCVEPLANARIRVYLPAPKSQKQLQQEVEEGIFNDMTALSAKEVLMKADRLLAEGSLDEKGNFSLSWEEVHLFTEALELDLCLDELPGRNGSRQSRNFHLSRLVLHWKRNSDGYVGAYAYVIPAAVWRSIYARAGAWVITGVVKPRFGASEESCLRVEAWNAITGQRIGEAFTNEIGRYTLHFSRQQLAKGSLQMIRPGSQNMGPDVFFRIYRNDQLLWAEDPKMAQVPERQDIGPCTNLNIIYKPSRVKWASDHIGTWFTDMITLTGTRKKKSDHYRLLFHPSLL